VLSHRGEVLVNPAEPGSTEPRQVAEGRDADERFPETLVLAELRDRLVDLDHALDFGTGGAVEWDYMDAAYGDDKEPIQLQVAEEAVGFGSRQAGRGFRTKVENLLRASPGRAVLLDWTGVPLPPSSFADEVLGRLFLTLGPVQFVQRMRLTGMEPLVRRLLDRAVMQRVHDAADPSEPA
jgi:anti-anti-sigma regulatory factor